MTQLFQQIKYFCEDYSFGVCTRLGDKMRISASGIRLYFIYASFLTLGSPVIVYLSMAFIMEMRKHFRRYNHPTVWEW